MFHPGWPSGFGKHRLICQELQVPGGRRRRCSEVGGFAGGRGFGCGEEPQRSYKDEDTWTMVNIDELFWDKNSDRVKLIWGCDPNPSTLEDDLLKQVHSVLKRLLFISLHGLLRIHWAEREARYSGHIKCKWQVCIFVIIWVDLGLLYDDFLLNIWGTRKKSVRDFQDEELDISCRDHNLQPPGSRMPQSWAPKT